MMNFDITLGDALQVIATIITVVVAVMKLSGKLDTLSQLFQQHVEHDKENFGLIRRDFDNFKNGD